MDGANDEVATGRRQVLATLSLMAQAEDAEGNKSEQDGQQPDERPGLRFGPATEPLEALPNPATLAGKRLRRDARVGPPVGQAPDVPVSAGAASPTSSASGSAGSTGSAASAGWDNPGGTRPRR